MSPTISPTAGPVAVTLKVYDALGRLLYSAPAGTTGALISDFSLNNDPWDADAGPLLLQATGFATSFAGRDSLGQELPSGVYWLVLESSQGGATSQAQKSVVLLRHSGSGLSVLVAPNPVAKGATAVEIYYAPLGPVWAEVHNLAGERLLNLGRFEQGRVTWNLMTPQGQSAVSGVYFVSLRRDGDRKPLVARVAVIR